jgi:predicted peptidase
MGTKIRLALNGKESVLYEEQDASIPRNGILALQVHSGGPIETAFRDILIQPLPVPSDSAADGHGFYVRKLRSGDGRAYTVSLPEGYDGVKRFPIILFLHGSGERGTDGVVPAQVGLGPQIFARPGDFPFVAVFPQARESWAGNGPDAAAALAALEEAMADFAVDPSRAYLTGLSMGGRGSWEIAAKHRDLFAAVVAVCGVSWDIQADDLRSIPAWAIVGDEDRLELVQGLRELVGSLGDQVRYTEYRGVGHNSWDRAYSDPEVFRWLLSHSLPSK